MSIDPALWVESATARGDDPLDRGRKLMHDIRHELATVQLLASVVVAATDVGPVSKVRVQQLIDETRWLERLVGRLDQLGGPEERTPGQTAPLAPERVRVDLVAGEVIAALQLATLTEVTLQARRCEAYIDRLALWRALRNVLDNACRAAGSSGHVAVQVSRTDGWSAVQVDDDGPGFGSVPRRAGALGLDIVRDMIGGYGGRVECRPSKLGGGCVGILLPAARTVDAGVGNGDRAHAAAHL